jgi:outer membrane immunogenic protein
MKRIAIAAMLSMIIASTALAADLSRPPPPPPQAPIAYIAPVYNWSGVYVGINGGWGFGNATVNVPNLIGTVATIPGGSASATDNGGVVGGTLGFNYQAGQWVFGAEGDWDYSGINTGSTNQICNNTGNCQTGNNWLATLRGRVGYAMDRVLFYGTGGGAFGNMQTTIDGTETTRTKAGWTAGAGVEWAFAENWTAKIEYLYVDLGNANASGFCSTAACLVANGGNPLPVTASASLTENLIRAGVNFKF